MRSSNDNAPRFLTSKNLSITIVGAVLLVALIKAKPEDIPEIVKTITNAGNFCNLGWIFAILFLLGGVIIVRLQSNSHSKEISRLARERDKLQERLLKQKNSE
jgi:hypothetical protein